MASVASDANQQWLRQSCTPPFFHADTPLSCNGESLSDLGASQDTAIVIPEDSDTEDEDYGGEEPHSPQSYTTTATSIANHSDSMGTKHGATGADAAITMETTPTESQVGVDGDSIRVYSSHLDPSADPELDVQTLRGTNHTPTASADFGSPFTNIESPSYPAMSDEQLFCDGSQNVVVTPSRFTHSPAAVTPEVTAQAPQSDSEACTSAEYNDTTRVHNPSLSPELSPELPPDQAQDQDRKSCSSSDTESGFSDAESGSLLGTQTCPPSYKGLSRHRSRRTSLRTREIVQDKNGGDTDTEDSDSEDGLDVPQHGRDEDYCPSLPEVQRYDAEDDHKDEVSNRRKRRKVSLSPYASPLGAPNSRQIRSTRSTVRSPGRRRTPPNPAIQHTGAAPSDVGTCVARFEEWPLSNVFLKRITEGNTTTFQLQFEWTPESNQLHAQASVPHHRDQESGLTSGSRTMSSGGKWTIEEENTVHTMRQAGRSWAEIHRALPYRSQGTIQVRYSTKLKYMSDSTRQ